MCSRLQIDVRLHRGLVKRRLRHSGAGGSSLTSRRRSLPSEPPTLEQRYLRSVERRPGEVFGDRRLAGCHGIDGEKPSFVALEKTM